MRDYLKIKSVSQDTQPTPEEDETIIWNCTSDGKVYIVHNSIENGSMKVELKA